ncbi:MAG: 3-phosphoshikimate 1-carboxyvinyltransferase, partial [Clostridia bacterium]|nr:3-phosphoshikimate 1-carboxyvinyltransferase [Clostridia bacterium]
MNVHIEKSKGKGKVTAPPSKSMAHRLLICAGLSKGKSIVHGVSNSEDVEATLDCLRSLGVKYETDGDTVTIEGADIRNSVPKNALACRESGSTLRFFIPIALLSGKNVILTGSDTLLKRPMSVYETIASEDGFDFLKCANRLMVKGPLKARNYRVPGNISSQFISGLLFALPLLESDSEIEIVPPIESRSYIELTIDSLRTFGVNVFWKDENTLSVPGNQEYAGKEVTVEGDYSNAAFFAALNALGSEIEIEGLKPDSLQGDKVYEKHIKSLLKGTPTIHLSDCPDLGPILFGVAAAKFGGIFTGTKRLKMKESDRGNVMAQELKKFGTDVTVHEDTIVVFPRKFEKPEEILDGHNDHRIVMTMAVLLTLTGGDISGAQAVALGGKNYVVY